MSQALQAGNGDVHHCGARGDKALGSVLGMPQSGLHVGHHNDTAPIEQGRPAHPLEMCRLQESNEGFPAPATNISLNLGEGMATHTIPPAWNADEGVLSAHEPDAADGGVPSVSSPMRTGLQCRFTMPVVLRCPCRRCLLPIHLYCHVVYFYSCYVTCYLHLQLCVYNNIVFDHSGPADTCCDPPSLSANDSATH